MKYGQRLAAAREYNNNKKVTLSQAKLAEIAGTSQANVSSLERGDATGSEFTAQFAIACGVSPLWLAQGKGTMEDNRFYVKNEELKAALLALDEVKEYLKTIATAEIIGVIQNVVDLNKKRPQQ
ncbi:MAG: helix-turn-helix domain-containing protein [Methylophilaceae bacterium]|nr:helix-turn-helix transcriptional regulator [Methyloradius sp.]